MRDTGVFSRELFPIKEMIEVVKGTFEVVTVAIFSCYVEMQDTIKAVDSYKEALSCFEKTLTKTPNSKSANLSKEKISQLIMQLEQCK